MHVFISYARADRDWVSALAGALESDGRAVWYDRRLAPGDSFDDVIEKALDAAYAVIVVWSAASVGSNWVRAEAGEGLRRGVLAPVMIDDAPIPLRFRAVHSADLSGWRPDRPNAEFATLADTLSALEKKAGGASAARQKSADAPPRATAKAAPSQGGAAASISALLAAGSVSAKQLEAGLNDVKIAMRLGETEYVIEHQERLSRQYVLLNDKKVAEGGALLRHDKQFEFPLVYDGVKYDARLILDATFLGTVTAMTVIIGAIAVLDRFPIKS